MHNKDSNDKPVLLKAIELVLASSESIHRETQALICQYQDEHNGKSKGKVRDLVAKKIISNYSYHAAFSGGATALTGVIPGLGTAFSVFGGAMADAALTMKYQIEMTMALACLYGRDIHKEEQKRICMMIAGLGTINEASKELAKKAGADAFVRIVKESLKGSTLLAVKQIFKQLGITFTRKALEKAIPFGIGVAVGFAANKGLTLYVGSKSRDFFAVAE